MSHALSKTQWDNGTIDPQTSYKKQCGRVVLIFRMTLDFIYISEQHVWAVSAALSPCLPSTYLPDFGLIELIKIYLDQFIFNSFES